MSTTLSYIELEQEILQELKKYSIGVLATSEGNNVTARSMMLLADGMKISCFTFTTTRKFR
jgi:general stress protein 26